MLRIWQAVAEVGHQNNIQTADNMEECEMSKLIKDDNEDEETPFYKAAFDCFDWNHSGRIATSVSWTAFDCLLFYVL